MSARGGQCLCGAVRFAARDVPDTFGVCHCQMCRRWTGSALLGVTVAADKVTWEGRDTIATIQSSAWAERAWCSKCGSGLWFRVTAQGAHSDDLEIPLGLFDDPDGLQMVREIYIDHKPDSFAFAGEGRALMTRQECIEKFSLLDSE
jgi:hypothetical protein